MGAVGNLYHRLLLVPGIPSGFRFALRNAATVFMLHRFADKDRGVPGLAAGDLRKGLEYLRKNKYEILSLGDLYTRLEGDGPSLKGAVVFTIDDGYSDHAEIGGPVFAEFDAPVTTFATTGFLDGKLWMWWDKIEFIFQSTRRDSVEVRIGEELVSYGLHRREGIQAGIDDFTKKCKAVADDVKHKAIASLAQAGEVDLPDKAPAMYTAMTWDQARSCEKRGMTFGPHTVTHPILSKTTSEMAEWEITESWSRLSAEVPKPVPVYCYPNGRRTDFSQREIDIFRKIKLLGAVVGEAGFADVASFKQDPDGRYKVRRLGYPETHWELVQFVSGIERCKQLVRSRT